MKINYFITICMLVFLPSCFFSSKENATTQTYFIQAPLGSAIVKELQDSMQPVVERILQEELGTSDYTEGDQKWALFFFKRRQAITIYYVNGLLEQGKEFLFSALESITNLPTPQKAALSSKVQFFGDDNSNLIDLVTLIDDPDKELAHLNKKIKEAANAANASYKIKEQKDLYDVLKSERFPYLPHLSIGYLRPVAVKKLIKDIEKTDDTLARIKERITKTISEKLSELLTSKNEKIFFDKLSIYDAKKREYIKNLQLGSKN